MIHHWGLLDRPAVALRDMHTSTNVFDTSCYESHSLFCLGCTRKDVCSLFDRDQSDLESLPAKAMQKVKQRPGSDAQD